MKRKILKSMLLLSLVTVLLTAALLSFAFYQQLSAEMKQEMKNQAVYIAAGIEMDGINYLTSVQGENNGSRITLIDTDGTVLFDNRASIDQMDNHKERPEVLSAMQYGTGEAVRMSDTIGSQTYYLALRLPDSTILRISSTTDTFIAALAKIVPLMLLVVLTILILSLFISEYQTRRIVKPINMLDLENPTEHEVYDELSPLLIRIHHQREHIENQMKELERKKDQFDEITKNMAEGLVVLDARGMVLSINQSALQFLGVAKSDYTGRHFSVLNRTLALQKAIQATQNGNTAEECFDSDRSFYQLRATPVLENGQIKGSILLILDMTEKQRAEAIRREFTANVSHELKTPVTVISGFAELMENGMVKQEEIPLFSRRIHEEATRLVLLIEDVMRLSQLDEKNVNLPMEKINLLEAAKNVEARLSTLATQKGLSLCVEGEDIFITGVPKLIDELISNLCENAIKYNREKGSVCIRVSGMDDRAVLSVSDTGIGIPAEYRDRVFERFFRVDKSHSREISGTGLGLSIVKHIANYHKASISLESVVGEGTKISVSFLK